MSVRNKQILTIFLFFTGILTFECYSIVHRIQSSQHPAQLKLQYTRNRNEDINSYNTFADFPDNEFSFDINSRVSPDEGDIPDNLCPNQDYFSTQIQTFGFSNKIFLSHLIFSIIDLPPPV